MLTNQSVLEASASLRAVIAATTKGLVEREALVEMVALSAVAEEHVLVIGPPGLTGRLGSVAGGGRKLCRRSRCHLAS